ncbi:Serine/threonine-protein kinase NIM1 [Araneus ventricosus]|uniref:non-specific serine/threonine protein kinase n=1 Tax=Araneus ventricosus TaxID=182803 RepID=A0A4Y2H673_ARAVE|nr:Serine/threonine-protein kinase NIM1 [Araneus ventricosus]
MPAAKVSPANNSYSNNCRDSRSSKDSSSSESQSLQETIKNEKQLDSLTPYHKVLHKLQTDEKWLQDITQGKRIGLYRLKEELGTGNFSQVRAGVHALTKERVAVKILDKSKLDNKTQKMLAREILSMETLHHPHVIRLYEVLETLSRIYLVMEYANGGELFHRISQHGSFSEKSARPLFAQITAAVDHMHSHNIVHRDLKAENVFFHGPNTVKVGDFGFSTYIQDSQEPLRTFCGSPPYAAPELFRDDSYVGPMVDVWALGVLLYFMLTASMPFKATTVSGLKKQILEGEYTIPDYLSTECHYLIVGILKQDPKSRTTLDQLKKSNWLMGQTLPEALPDVGMVSGTADCNGNGTVLSGVDMCVRERVAELGITDAMLEEASRKGSRSSVTGTYRIVLHRILSESKPTERKILDAEIPQFLKLKNSPKNAKQKKNKKSKTCNIL